MWTRVQTTFWRFSLCIRRPNTKIITIHRSSSQISTIVTSIFEPIPREELVTKFKSRLRDRQFLPGSSEGGFPEFLAEPRDSFPLGVCVLNSNQFTLAELTTKCMEYVKENVADSPAVLFRGLPAKTADDFSVIAQAIQGQTLTFQGGMGNRLPVDKNAGTYTASDHPKPYTIELHNEMSYNDNFPSKVSRHVALACITSSHYSEARKARDTCGTISSPEFLRLFVTGWSPGETLG